MPKQSDKPTLRDGPRYIFRGWGESFEPSTPLGCQKRAGVAFRDPEWLRVRVDALTRHPVMSLRQASAEHEDPRGNIRAYIFRIIARHHRIE